MTNSWEELARFSAAELAQKFDIDIGKAEKIRQKLDKIFLK